MLAIARIVADVCDGSRGAGSSRGLARAVFDDPQRVGFVLNAREAQWTHSEKFGAAMMFEASLFTQCGVNIQVMWPGQPNGYYHAEEGQEDFLVLRGECLLS
jgi:uncharacterized cupin superfamily protein